MHLFHACVAPSTQEISQPVRQPEHQSATHPTTQPDTHTSSPFSQTRTLEHRQGGPNCEGVCVTRDRASGLPVTQGGAFPPPPNHKRGPLKSRLLALRQASGLRDQADNPSLRRPHLIRQVEVGGSHCVTAVIASLVRNANPFLRGRVSCGACCAHMQLQNKQQSDQTDTQKEHGTQSAARRGLLSLGQVS